VQPSIHGKLEYYRDKLLRTDGRNHSILLSRIRDKWCFDLTIISSEKKVMDHALLDKRSIRIRSTSDRSELGKKDSTRLRYLYRNIVQIERDKGLKETYLGFPFLTGNVNREFYVRGPLILFPISLQFKQEGKQQGWYIEFPEDEKPILNRALMEAIKKKGGPNLTDSFSDELEDLLNTIEDGKEITSTNSAEATFATGLIRLLKVNEFPLDTDSDLDKVSIFNPLAISNGKVSINEIPIENEKLHLENLKIIGIFPQTDSAIYGDYVELLKNVPNMGNDFGIIGTLLRETSADHDIVSQVDSNKNNKDESESIKLDEISADALNLSMESDASQDSVVVASQSSQCTVVRGPPGTGKSQVIVNLISNSLAKEQKVLLVCQKKYALDVVYSRLEKIGLAKHIAILRDVQSGRAPLYKKLASILESKDISDDINLLNIEFKHICQEIDRIVKQQAKLIEALKDERELGVSINKLYILAKPGYVPRLLLSKFGQDVKYYMLQDLIGTIKNLESDCRNFDNSQYPWKHRADFSKLGSSDENSILKIIDNIKQTLDEREGLIQTSNIESQQTLLESLQELGSILEMFLNNERGYKVFDSREFPWASRRNFSNFTSEDRDVINLTIDALLTLKKPPDIVLVSNLEDQEQLVDSLEILISQKGFFSKINPKRRNAHDICERLLKHKISDDSSQLNKLKDSAAQGLILWRELIKLHKFLNKSGFDELIRIILSEPQEVFDAKLRHMKNALRNFDELTQYDIRKKELLSQEDKLQRRWNDAYTVATELFNEFDIHRGSSGSSLLKQRMDQSQKILNYNYDISQPLLNDVGFDEIKQTLVLSQDETIFSRIHTMRSNIEFTKQRVEKCLRIFNSIMDLSSFLNETGLKEITEDFISSNFDSLYSKLYKMRDSLKQDFDRLQEYDIRKAGLNPIQKEVLDLCNATLISDSNWDEIVKQEFYRYWIDYLESKHEVLRGNPFGTYLHNRNQLANLIARHRDIVIKRIMSQISGSIIRPSTRLSTNRQYKVHYNPWSALLDELNKKRHILSIRKLVEKYDSIILRIAPCWLATPEAVSSIFPLRRDLFDFVIFDEASQSEVQTSITALYRGKNVVILGDEKQLPPSQWFIAKDDEEENDEEYADRTLLSESVLALVSRVFSYTYLTWHYRSSYQELIDFSNHAFYDKCLKVVPNINKVFKPIKWITCENGTWENRKNGPEARLVVDELKHILFQNKQNNLKRSIGIITFNAPQQDAIEDEIDLRIEKDPEFAQLFLEAQNQQDMLLSDLPFVKNIEKVQGDERDVIIISVGYAKELKDAQDTISVNFGALNQMGGENRLNVAVTRARKEIIIVCSFDPNRIKVDKKNYGSKRLRDYLIYAKSISELNTKEAKKILTSLDQDLDEYKSHDDMTRAMTEEVPFENIIQSELRELGYTVDTRVGNSDYTLDLAVVDPDNSAKYLLGIECDGQSFLSAASTRERDITRQDFLENKGWRLERVWSRNWWRNPEKELGRLQQRIEELRLKNKSEESDAVLDRVMPELRAENDSQFSVLDKQPSIVELIEKGESNTIEFKTSMRWDYAAGKRGASDMGQLSILKTIAAFMNSEGGLLIVGVEDNGNILGIEKDFETFSDRKNWDGWVQHIVNVVRKHIGTEFLEHIRVEAILCDGKTVALIRVQKSYKPAFVEYQDTKGGQSKVEFYYRALNTTQALNTKQASDYIKEHWKNS
jgi:very-short-patch-repair endonuclease